VASDGLKLQCIRNCHVSSVSFPAVDNKMDLSLVFKIIDLISSVVFGRNLCNWAKATVRERY